MLNLISWQQTKSHLLKLSVFLLCAFVISFLVPIKRGSRYQYTKDKPWQGTLLTAPYDFPIYKAEEQLQREKDSITQHQHPVYAYQYEIAELMTQELMSEYQHSTTTDIPEAYLSYVSRELSKAYQTGIIKVDELKRLREEKKLEVLLIKRDNELEKIPTTTFRTLKEVHDQIIQNKPAHLDIAILHQMRVERFLTENIVYDQTMSSKLLDEAISNISHSVGMVQTGQRIIDKGEIVTPYTYNLLRSLDIEYEKRSGGTFEQYRSRIGIFVIALLTLLLLGSALIFLVKNYTPTQKNNAFILVLVVPFVILSSYVNFYGLFSIYAIPYVMVIILIRTFMNSYTAILCFTATILLAAIFTVDPLSFIIIQMLAGLAALVSLTQLNSRGKMIRAAFIVYLVYSVVYSGMHLIRNGNFDTNYWGIQAVLGINTLFLVTPYILSSGVERIFGYVSGVNLVELSDINTPLLRELSEVAPGTFQHALQVSILAADAADKIGGDVALIRAGALYHDIGKMKNPAYFTENQGDNNPHALLSPVESAAIIIRHVTDGIALAQKHNLPEQIIDFIRTHHSDSLVKYFYTTHCNQNADEEVDPSPFTYPGPRPFTREQGILMLADVTEASSRSLKEYTVETISQHVHRMVDNIVSEGHLNNTPLTFRDIQKIKEVFISKLKTMYHTRISYPDRKA